MFKFRSDIVFRFNLVVILGFLTFAFVIIGSASVTMFKEREIWNKIKERYVQDSIPIMPERGRILDEDGKLIVSSLPYYRLRIDFKYVNEDNQRDAEEVRGKREELWNKHLVEVSQGLSDIFPDESAESFEKRLREGFKNQDRYFRLYNGKVSYTQYNRLLQLPIFKEGTKYSGLFSENDKDFVKNKKDKAKTVNRNKVERKSILGDAGLGTFGIFRESYDDKGNMTIEMTGLEKKYNKYLSGKPGVGRKETNRKGKSITKVKQPAENGMDLQTTINTEMLDICQSALEKQLREKTLAAGWAILMETKSGDIKAIVNLTRDERSDGSVHYVENPENPKYLTTSNHALCDLNQPGSIFKTVALTAILADGKLTTKDSVIAYQSMVHSFNGHRITDEMYRDNGTGKYSMSDAMMYSSNIGLVQFIRKAYLDDPKQYTNTLRRFGLADNYYLIDNESTPNFPEKGNPIKGNPKWDGYSINSLSIGYAINMTAINMVSFYNTIANGGKQMKPRLVKAALRDGKVIEEFPTTVLNEQLFPKSVADEMTKMLVKVVNGKSIVLPSDQWRYGKRDGTGKNAYSEMMTIAGKTGTAVSHLNKKNKLLSFCGFFPAEDPQYTLIVQVMYDYNLDPRPVSVKEDRTKQYGGGNTSAYVFKEIAEKVMAKKMRSDIAEAKDIPENYLPLIKSGKMEEVKTVLDEMGITNSVNGNGKETWGTINRNKDGKGYGQEIQETDIYKVPDLAGMGAKDAVYLLHRRKMKVLLNGYGSVIEQSIPPGIDAIEGETITLTLSP